MRLSTLVRSAVVALLFLSVTAASSHRIEEDEPGWVCSTMGNRICGPA